MDDREEDAVAAAVLGSTAVLSAKPAASRTGNIVVNGVSTPLTMAPTGENQRFSRQA